MAYEKQTWTCDELITADKLNHMEDGIANGGGGGGMESVTYAELKAMRDNGTLTPGTQYRITDYECTTTQEDSRVVAHSFDVIVVADDEKTLNENARACLRDGDTYYSASNHDANLEAWELKYSIDNDTNRFAWADATNGKGVIYWLKDEKDNECPYDFKQIQFKVTTSSEGDEVDPSPIDEGGGSVKSALTLKAASGGDGSETATSKWLYTFSVRDSEATEVVSNDASVSKQDATGCRTYGNIIRPYRDYQDRENESGLNIQYLNGITFDNLYNEEDGGAWCNSNTFGDNCYSNTFGNACYSNTFGTWCNSNTFGTWCYSNTFGDECYSNTFGDNCYSNTFGNACYSNTFGDNCYSNTFGNACNSNTFGDNCYSNTFGDECYSNTFGDNCYSNTFGNACYSNTFGDECYSNTFGDECYSNTFGTWCNSNTFGDECYFNTFGDRCNSNTFGDECYSNTFGDECYSNTFGTWCNSNTFGDECYFNTFGNECSFIDFFKGAATMNNRFYHVLDGTAGTNSSQLAISGTANNNYVTYVGKNSSGVLKTWIPADSVA